MENIGKDKSGLGIMLSFPFFILSFFLILFSLISTAHLIGPGVTDSPHPFFTKLIAFAWGLSSFIIAMTLIKSNKVKFNKIATPIFFIIFIFSFIPTPLIRASVGQCFTDPQMNAGAIMEKCQNEFPYKHYYSVTDAHSTTYFEDANLFDKILDSFTP